jgi:hypothetical protein
MFFVQEEQLENLINDIREKNNNLSSFNLTVPTDIQDKIMSDYAIMIDIFISNKDNITAQDFLDYIGTKSTH